MNSNKKRDECILPKIKIPQHDLKSFILESLEIDPFWYDLYCIEPKKDNKTKETLK